MLSLRADLSPTPLPRRSNAPSRSLGPPSPPSSWEEAFEQAAVQSAPPAAPAQGRASPSSTRPYSVLNTLLSAPVIVPSNPAPRARAAAPPRPNTPPPTARPGNALAPSPASEPRTPRSHTRGRTAVREMPPPNPPTPGSGRRKLSLRELETYNVVVRALAGASVKLSVKGQNALREIVKEDDFWIDS
ncbi:hypothetical protein CONLIGDRAFT_635546 [Coniochaeta ligniaria NRRL 30616]|uniref:Uncharacterized protein n=1 Tax=Coniochaeta ligniaria NRRL 30616 TaxID=1408157 RepID=A0A1J7IXF8_9PEZI|nr:hypothetical protein CONLIGDRAFT_635546 [Coniochaeta ligniaria NRRL 30616]